MTSNTQPRRRARHRHCTPNPLHRPPEVKRRQVRVNRLGRLNLRVPGERLRDPGVHSGGDDAADVSPTEANRAGSGEMTGGIAIGSPG